MPLFAYNRDIPDGPNNPSVDQPDMKTNTNSIDDIIDVDHYSFDENNGGLHRQVRLVDETIPAVTSGQIGIYSKTPLGSQSQEFITSAGGLKEYQMTRFIDANFANFGIASTLGDSNGGWSFLPGGLLVKYGLLNGVTSSFQTFTPAGPAYTTAPNAIVLTPNSSSTTTDVTVQWANTTTTTFDARVNSGTRQVSYIIIGN